MYARMYVFLNLCLFVVSVCMYVCMYESSYVRIYVCMHVCRQTCRRVGMWKMHRCMDALFACMYLCVYVRMHILGCSSCIPMHTRISIRPSLCRSLYLLV